MSETHIFISPKVTVGLLGVEVPSHAFSNPHMISNLRLEEIERRILAIEARANSMDDFNGLNEFAQ